MIRMLVVDRQALMRTALRSLLTQLDGVDVVAEAGNDKDALEAVAIHRPDIVLLDVDPPEIAGIATATRIKAEWPAVQVILLHTDLTPRSIRQSFDSGASGHLSKDGDPSELQTAVRAVAMGGSFISPSITRMTIAHLAEEPDDPLARLTQRQRQILPLLANGHTSKAIAAELGISVRTVDTHRAAIMQRLRLTDMAGVIRLALRHGLISLDRETEKPSEYES